MIYLFCNETYGQPLLMSLHTERFRPPLPITIVLSGKHDFPNNPFKKLLRQLKLTIKNKLKEYQLSKSYGIPVHIVKNINSYAFHKRMKPQDKGIIFGFNQIFQAPTIALFQELVNFHPSILPLYRGPVPSYWCIKNGEAKTGYTLHRVTPKIDQGEILFQEVVEIGEIQDANCLDQAIAQKALPTFYQYLDYLATGKPWIPIKLEAEKIYKIHIDYLSFPSEPICSE